MYLLVRKVNRSQLLTQLGNSYSCNLKKSEYFRDIPGSGMADTATCVEVECCKWASKAFGANVVDTPVPIVVIVNAKGLSFKNIKNKIISTKDL